MEKKVFVFAYLKIFFLKNTYINKGIMVTDPNISKHLAHFGIDVSALQKVL